MSSNRYLLSALVLACICAANCGPRRIPDTGTSGGATGSTSDAGSETGMGVSSVDESPADETSAGGSSSGQTDLPQADCSETSQWRWGCACEDDGDCENLLCNLAVGACVAPNCTRGTEGCACGYGCDDGLNCTSGFCAHPSCPTGSPGCKCLPGGICYGGYACGDDELC